MATEYGIRYLDGDDWGWTLENGIAYVRSSKKGEAVLIAREVSEPRIVSIRA